MNPAEISSAFRDHRNKANRYLTEHGLPPMYGREG